MYILHRGVQMAVKTYIPKQSYQQFYQAPQQQKDGVKKSLPISLKNGLNTCASWTFSKSPCSLSMTSWGFFEFDSLSIFLTKIYIEVVPDSPHLAVILIDTQHRLVPAHLP